MAGETNYVDDKMNEVVNRLETLSKSLLIDRVNVNPQAEKYLSLAEEDIEKMTPSELAAGEYILSAYGLILQRRLNRANAIKGWANGSIERLIAKTYKDYDQMMKYEIRKASISQYDSYGKRLSDIVVEQDAVISDLTYISQCVSNLSNSLGNLARIRSRNNNAFTTREN